MIVYRQGASVCDQQHPERSIRAIRRPRRLTCAAWRPMHAGGRIANQFRQGPVLMGEAVICWIAHSQDKDEHHATSSSCSHLLDLCRSRRRGCGDLRSHHGRWCRRGWGRLLTHLGTTPSIANGMPDRERCRLIGAILWSIAETVGRGQASNEPPDRQSVQRALAPVLSHPSGVYGQSP